LHEELLVFFDSALYVFNADFFNTLSIKTNRFFYLARYLYSEKHNCIMAKILVTGGSGFIGTNLVAYLSSKNNEVLNFDICKPRNQSFLKNWIKGDILNREELLSCFNNFNPEYVIHFAARTDLDETKSIEGYAANIEGVDNVVGIINTFPGIKRTIYASSRMVCRIDYVPSSFDDYCPPNLYGESKVIGEKIVNEKANHDYVIVRPTSIWGPYFEIPYRTFFDTVRKKMFFIPKENVDTNVWDIPDGYLNKNKKRKLMAGDYVKIQIMDKRINQNDSQIKSIGRLIDFASPDEVEKYYGSKIVSEKIIDNTKLDDKTESIESVNTDEPETDSNYIM
jgi:hypothetical protein